MNTTLKLTTNPLFRSIIGDRKLKAFRNPVDGRLGMLGLSKLVVKTTGHMPRRDEAYLFYLGTKNVVKVLSTDQIGQSIMEFYGTQAKAMKAELAEMGVVRSVKTAII
ncbi:IS66 family insertion sequence element accessory protein TnpB [Pedobacter ginsengisoli]|uniref:IS66 family insertion sequence element accessory protein TnpB n=1 Tax=Pedobacter ginsengisoli TaxID=363852 RepID=UPI0032B819C4